MEKNKQSGKNITIAVLILLLGLSIAYIGYYKLMNDGNQNNVITNYNNNYINDFYTNLKEEKRLQRVRANKIDVFVDKKGDVYYNLNDNNYQLLENVITKKEYQIEGYIKEIGNDSNIFEGYKIDISNVVNAYFSYVGNGGSAYVFLIKSDGTVGYLRIDTLYSNQISIKFEKNISNLKNIVSFTNIYHIGGDEFCFVDINGHIISATNYVR